jgi:hypothetical protein
MECSGCEIRNSISELARRFHPLRSHGTRPPTDLLLLGVNLTHARENGSGNIDGRRPAEDLERVQRQHSLPEN